MLHQCFEFITWAISACLGLALPKEVGNRLKSANNAGRGGAAIAQWIRLCLHILPSQVRVPSTPSTLLSFIVFVLHVSCEKNENKRSRGWVWPI